MQSFAARVTTLANRLAGRPEHSLLLVTHGGIILGLLCLFLGLKPEQYGIFQVNRGSVTTLELCDGKGVLTELNRMGDG